MTPVLQMPYRERAATEVGPRLFRKQILKVGRIPYDGKELVFDQAYLQRAVDSFKAGAFEQVPFVIADQENRHRADPEAFRGEVKALEMAGDGIDALIELTEEGAEMVRKNPRLGVSARLVPNHERDGSRFPVAVEHVCATLNPRVSGLQPWQAGSIRSLSQSSDQVIDLSAADYMPETKTPSLTDDQLTELQGLKPEERAAKVAEILGESKPEPKPEDEKKQRFPALRKLLGLKDDSTDSDLDAALAKLADGDEPADEKKDEPQLDTASLSKEAREAIDLANTRAATAQSSVTDLAEQLAEEKWKNERKDYEGEGVPPSLLDLASPVMTSAAKTIDLSNGETVDPKALMRKMLDEAKGTIDLSTVGSAKDKELEDQAKELASDEKWNASI